jgi:hypothetical protein
MTETNVLVVGVGVVAAPVTCKLYDWFAPKSTASAEQFAYVVTLKVIAGIIRM